MLLKIWPNFTSLVAYPLLNFFKKKCSVSTKLFILIGDPILSNKGINQFYFELMKNNSDCYFVQSKVVVVIIDHIRRKIVAYIRKFQLALLLKFSWIWTSL